MLIHTSLSVAALAGLSSASFDITPNAVPKFETFFYGEFELNTIDSLNATSGMRVDIALKGGNLTDTSGNFVATALPNADTGFISNSGIFFPQGTMFWRWVADDTLAYLRLDGVGVPYQSDVVYVYMETDSEAHSALNGRFLVANVTFGAGKGSNPLFTLYRIHADPWPACQFEVTAMRSL